MIEDSRRLQKSWQETLAQGGKLRVALKGALIAPTDAETTGSPPVTRLKAKSVEVYVLETDYETEPSGEFRDQIVTDEVLKVAVYDKTLPSQAAATGKTGLYGHVELIDGILELTWIAC